MSLISCAKACAVLSGRGDEYGAKVDEIEELSEKIIKELGMPEINMEQLVSGLQSRSPLSWFAPRSLLCILGAEATRPKSSSC